MEQFKRAQVIMLPTQYNNTQLALSLGIGEFIGSIIPKGDLCTSSSKGWSNAFRPQHLYIISDDEIKEGDWVVSKLNEIVLLKPNYTNFNYKKIIATTDTSIYDPKYESKFNKGWYLPQLSQQFIEKYIESYNKGEIITDVLVEYEANLSTITKIDYGLQHWDYKLKINPKDNTITIKKLKESWNREEVIELLKLAWKESDSQYDQNDWVFNGEDEINITTYFEKDINKWIEENL